MSILVGIKSLKHSHYAILKIENTYNTYRHMSKAHDCVSLNMKFIWKSSYWTNVTMTHGYSLTIHGCTSPKLILLVWNHNKSFISQFNLCIKIVFPLRYTYGYYKCNSWSNSYSLGLFKMNQVYYLDRWFWVLGSIWT